MDYTFSGLVGMLVSLIYRVVPLLFGLIFLIIVWRVVDGWIIHGGDQKAIDSGKSTIISGVVVLVVLAGLWGLVALLKSSLFGS